MKAKGCAIGQPQVNAGAVCAHSCVRALTGERTRLRRKGVNSHPCVGGGCQDVAASCSVAVLPQPSPTSGDPASHRRPISLSSIESGARLLAARVGTKDGLRQVRRKSAGRGQMTRPFPVSGIGALVATSDPCLVLATHGAPCSAAVPEGSLCQGSVGRTGPVMATKAVFQPQAPRRRPRQSVGNDLPGSACERRDWEGKSQRKPLLMNARPRSMLLSRLCVPPNCAA